MKIDLTRGLPYYIRVITHYILFWLGWAKNWPYIRAIYKRVALYHCSYTLLHIILVTLHTTLQESLTFSFLPPLLQIDLKTLASMTGRQYSVQKLSERFDRFNFRDASRAAEDVFIENEAFVDVKDNDDLWWMLINYDQWSLMISDHRWSVITYDQWSLMIRDHWWSVRWRRRDTVRLYTGSQTSPNVMCFDQSWWDVSSYELFIFLLDLSRSAGISWTTP